MYGTVSWSTFEIDTNQHLQKMKTDPILVNLFIQSISEWKTVKAPEYSNEIPEEYTLLFRKQSLIGWSQVIKGRLSQ